MQITFSSALLLSFFSVSLAFPVLEQRADRGSYTVPGIGARKALIVAAGGDSLDVAIAMEENSDMNANYPYGDSKSGDSANFGIFKQNWFMLRTSTNRFRGQQEGGVANGAVLNSDLNADVLARHNSQDQLGATGWYAGHRNGATGIANPNTADIASYQNAIEWIQAQINTNSGRFMSDDTRFWVDVPAI